MRKNFTFSLFSFALIFVLLSSSALVAQSVITGEWTAEPNKEKSDKIHLSFERRTEKGGRNQHGSGFAFDDLQGLSRDATQNGKVNFKLVREAGTIECEGAFVNGRGSGTFRFTGNQSFVDAMRSRGFDLEKSMSNREGQLEDRLFTAATLNLTTAFADDLKSANFGPLDVDDLFKAVIFKITPQFMAEMKATGFPGLSFEDLVKARIFKIDAEFVRKIREMGFGTQNFESLVKFSIFKVTPEFLNEIKNEGLTDLSADDVVKLRIFKIDAAYIRESRGPKNQTSMSNSSSSAASVSGENSSAV